MLCHTEAIHYLRRMLFEMAIRLFPDLLQHLDLNVALANVYQRQKLIDRLFESHLCREYGFSLYRAYNKANYPESQKNFTILFKTFVSPEQMSLVIK